MAQVDLKLTLFNTLSKKKELFSPIKEGEVCMYHCGPTVYHYFHIGNLRSFLLADLLKRVFLFAEFKVKQVINITDVGHLTHDDEGEDKIEQEAKKEGKTAQEIARFYTDIFFHDLAALNINTKSTQFPRATEYIKQQIELIATLEDKGYAYTIPDGVYFDTSKFKGYGKLGNINLMGLEEGTRITENKEKRNATDFALWKKSVAIDNRQQEWDSPWGVGFPGWHIECSAMGLTLLGETFDIHTGGIDLIPTHHNNEIAQSESATGKPFVRFWLHNEFLTIGDEKMSKSVKNFYTLSDLTRQNIHPLSYRYFLLTAHYRSPLHFSWEALRAAHTALRRLAEHVESFHQDKTGGSIVLTYSNRFMKAIDDDLNTPQAVAVMWELIRDAAARAEDKYTTLLSFDDILGLNIKDLPLLFPHTLATPKVLALVQEREKARQNKDFKKADSIRMQIENLGFTVKDTDTGPHIEALS
ncbi:MAG: cysteine--tRNA ligase [Patescibacteria group bacterium]